MKSWNRIWNQDLVHDLEECNSRDYTSDKSNKKNDPGIDVDPTWPKSKLKLKLKSKSKLKSKLKSKSKSKLKSKSKSKSDKKNPVLDALKKRIKNNPGFVMIQKQKIPPSFLTSTSTSKSKSKSKPDSNSNQNQVTMPSTSQNNNLPSDEWDNVAKEFHDLSEKMQTLGVYDEDVNEPDQLKEPLFDMHDNKHEYCKPKPLEFPCPYKLSKNVPCPYKGIFIDLQKHVEENAMHFQGLQNKDVLKFFKAKKKLWTVWEQIEDSERHIKFFKPNVNEDGLQKAPDRSGWEWSKISNNCFLQHDGPTFNKIFKIAIDFLNQQNFNLPEVEMEQYATRVLIPQVQVNLLMEEHEMTNKMAEKIFQNYSAPDPEDQMEENLQMAQAPTFVETIEEDDIPDDIDIENNTGEVFEPDVGAPTYVLDGQVPSTSRDMAASAKNFNLLQVIDLSDFKRPKVLPKKSGKGGKNTYKKKQCPEPEIKRTCIECKQIFADRSGLIKHQRFYHRDSNGYSKFIHQCQFCDEVFRNPVAWHNHKRTVMYENNKSLEEEKKKKEEKEKK